DTKALFAQIQTDLASAQPSAAAILSQLAAQSPTFGVTGARFENDRFVMDSGATLPAAAAANTDRGLAAETPEDAIFFADGPNGGPRVQVSQADHAGTSITTIQFEASNSVPSWVSTLQYAVTDQRVVIGSGSSFVASVLDMQSGNSLAASLRFRTALDGVG